MGKKKTYVASPRFWKEMFSRHNLEETWTPVDRVPLEKIRVDKSILENPNEVDDAEVLRMLLNFDPECWLPITVNEDYYLLDGQHRLKVARQLCLKYIDVIVERRRPVGSVKTD